ncbi:MAG: TonB-dependent receptor [Bacteroidota bacterium]
MRKIIGITGLTMLMILLMGAAGFAQSPLQKLRGMVYTSSSLQPIEGAEIAVRPHKSNEAFTKATTKADGTYELTDLSPGRYTIKAKKKGFIEFVISDYQISSGKEAIVDFALETTVFEGETVNITQRNEREFIRPSVHLLKVEDTKRFAASFLDPARVTVSLPGVVNTDNQSNNLVIRGNSPNGVKWRLEGVEVANPNHLPNAGTFSDRISLSGGGQNILSTQLMDNSIFTKGAFEAEYGNALSGVFDMRLRAGNNQNREYTLQAGLIGVDLAAEGPFSKNSKASYLANYRYSFTGLLATMGVTFGGEDIRFQDFSFNLNFPTEKAGTFTLFGVGGLSTNVFTGARSDSAIETGKDRFDIDFSSRVGAVGATHQISLGTRSNLRSVLVLSGISSSRSGKLITDFDQEPIEVERDELTQSYLSFNSTLSHQISNKAYLKTGLFFTQQFNRIQSTFDAGFTGNPVTRVENEGSTSLIEPFVSFQYRPTVQFQLNAGLHGQYLTLNGAFALEPRLNLHFSPNEKHGLSLAYGLHSQQQFPQIYYTRLNTTAEGSFPNRDLDFTRAHHIVLNYQFRPNEDWLFKVEPYYQQLFNVPVVPDVNRHISLINLIEGYVTDSLVNTGSGRNYGIEVMAQKYLSDKFYTLVSGSLYEAKFTAFDGVERDSRFNGNYAVSATMGYENERVTQKGKEKIFGVNLRIVQVGGFLLQPVDTAASIEQQTTVYDQTQGFTERLDDLFRVDLGISFKRNKENKTRTFSIDMQNLTNNQPVAFRVFDVAEQKVVDRLRFGLFPVISYRLEF